MKIFTKPVKEPQMPDNNQPVRSKMLSALDHLNASHHHLSEAMNLFSMINFDLQKGADYIARYRDMLVNAVEASGGKVEAESVEEQIKEFLPKHLQRAPEAPNT